MYLLLKLKMTSFWLGEVWEEESIFLIIGQIAQNKLGILDNGGTWPQLLRLTAGGLAAARFQVNKIFLNASTVMPR